MNPRTRIRFWNIRALNDSGQSARVVKVKLRKLNCVGHTLHKDDCAGADTGTFILKMKATGMLIDTITVYFLNRTGFQRVESKFHRTTTEAAHIL